MSSSVSKIFMRLLLLLCTLLLWKADGFRTCDTSSDNMAADENIADHINRLMEFRKPDWGWMNTPEAVLALQLTNQKSFFGRNQTLGAMKTEMLDEFQTMNIGKFALYVMAVKSLCENPQDFAGKNLLTTLKRRLHKQFITDDQLLPEGRWYRYSLAVGAKCVCGKTIKMSIINKFIRGQNEDGSFGGGHSVDDTAQAILALVCVHRQKARGKVLGLIEKGTYFLQSEGLVVERNKIWLGNKYSTPAAILALKEAQQMDTIDCMSIVDSLNKPFASNEFESAISQRLPGLAGRSYLSLMDNWKYDMPTGYQPTYDPNNIADCVTVDETDGIINVDIDVTLKVFVDDLAHISTDQPDIVVNVTMNKGGSLLDALTKAQCLNQIRFQSEMTSWGASIRSVEGVAAATVKREFWSLLHEDGSWLSTGASNYLLSHAEVVILKLATW